METGPPFYVVIRATRRSMQPCRAMEVPSFLSYFKTLSIVPARESNPQPPALQSSALPTDLNLPRLMNEITNTIDTYDQIAFWFGLFKRGIAISTGQISTSSGFCNWFPLLILIHWIVISLLDSAIQLLDNSGLDDYQICALSSAT